MKYKPAWYASPLNLPPGRSGNVALRHRTIEPGQEVPVVGTRQAILRGIRPAHAVLTESLTVHELVHDKHGLWMTDLPEELNQIAELLATVQPMGRVLIGGLGLGILAQACAARELVNRIVVVEIDPDVIALCKTEGYEVVQADLAEYLKTSTEKFDYYLLDTWQGTNEGTWWNTVMPLRRTIRQRYGRGPVIHCWAEDIMLGQIVRSLTTKPEHWFYTGLPVPMTQAKAQRFVANVGLPGWEDVYGEAVNRNLAEQGR